MVKAAGIILSAGESSRMGMPKALLPYKNTSILEHVIFTQIESGLDPIIVVLGAHTQPLDKIAENARAKVVYNKEWKKGQQSSLNAGLNAIPENVNTIVVSLIDHPGVLPGTISKLIAATHEVDDCIIQPVFNSRPGHPLVLKGRIINIIKKYPLVDGGTKTVISEHSNMIRKILVDDQAILEDIDTIELYNECMKNVK